jgi:hypothetical protein
MLDRGRVKTDLTKELNAKLVASTIQILQKEFAEPYAKMLDQLKTMAGRAAGSGG